MLASPTKFGAAAVVKVMTNLRQQMHEQLKRVVVPYLREIGFKGSYPTLYRVGERGTDLINFQFSRNGGSFVINVARVRPDAVKPPAELRIAQTDVRRHTRLGGGLFRSDKWFDYIEGGRYETAEKVLRLVASRDHWAKLEPCNLVAVRP